MLFLKIPAFDINSEYFDIAQIFFSSSETSFEGKILTNVQNYYSIVVIFAIIILSFIALLMFKKNELQSKLIQINFVFILMILVSLYFEINRQNIPKEINYELEYKWGIVLPFILLLLNFLALKGILNDKRRLKSSRSIR